MYLAPQDNYMSPFPQETVSQFVIPAKSRKAGREPGSTKDLIILNFHCGESFDFAQDREPVERPVEPRISPDLGGLVRNDGFCEW